MVYKERSYIQLARNEIPHCLQNIVLTWDWVHCIHKFNFYFRLWKPFVFTLIYLHRLRACEKKSKWSSESKSVKWSTYLKFPRDIERLLSLLYSPLPETLCQQLLKSHNNNIETSYLTLNYTVNNKSRTSKGE